VQQREQTASQELTQQVLKHVFGSQVLFLPFSCEEEEGGDEKSCSYRASGFLSHPNNKAIKKTTLVLFVNNRLVECAPLKRILQDLGSAMIMYLSITVPGTQVDVNVHPTKKQVTLLYQDEVLGGVERRLRSLLQAIDQTFASTSVQSADKTRKSLSEEGDEPPPPPRSASAAPHPSNLVRTTKAAPAGALEPYLVSTNRQEHNSGCPLFDIDITQPGAFAQQCTCPLVRLTPKSVIRPKRITPTACTYRSIQSLRKVFFKHKTNLMAVESLLRNAVWVGQVSPHQSLVQCGVELWMWNVREIWRKLYSINWPYCNLEVWHWLN
jgi:DNA mismatch repair protein MLH1